mmetsp:Transcript_1758/g.3160  ORF Transcript_1758/g.3160 Transcript_1758/m.3160 type:complete len:323 (-) Transcript_1758:351-1319(-)
MFQLFEVQVWNLSLLESVLELPEEEDARSWQADEGDDWKVVLQEGGEANRELGPNDNVWGITDQCASATNGCADGHRQVNVPRVEVHLLAKTVRQRTEEHNSCHVVQEHTQNAANVGQCKKELLFIALAELHHLDGKPVEKASLLQHPHEDHHGEQEHESAKVNHRSDGMQMQRLLDGTHGADCCRSSQHCGVDSMNLLADDAYEANHKDDDSNDLSERTGSSHLHHLGCESAGIAIIASAGHFQSVLVTAIGTKVHDIDGHEFLILQVGILEVNRFREKFLSVSKQTICQVSRWISFTMSTVSIMTVMIIMTAMLVVSLFM